MKHYYIIAPLIEVEKVCLYVACVRACVLARARAFVCVSVYLSERANERASEREREREGERDIRHLSSSVVPHDVGVMVMTLACVVRRM